MQNIEPESAHKRDVNGKIVHVCVAVIVRNKRVLIARRPEHVYQGGLWEFPGGKVEAGESVEQALRREISEELGITILSSQALIKTVHHYADKSVCLETFLVDDFTGQDYPEDETGTGSEGQDVLWVDIEQLQQFEFPGANRVIINALQLPRVYAITPDYQNTEDFEQNFTSLVQTQSLLQLRLKSIRGARLEALLTKALQLAKNSPVRLVLNSSMDRTSWPEHLYPYISGLHLTRGHLLDNNYIDQYRADFPDKLLSASCHDKAEVERANALKLDYITISPVQKTASHPGLSELGWDTFEQLTQLATMPVYALGGMNTGHVRQAQLCGAQGIAAIRGILNNE